MSLAVSRAALRAAGRTAACALMAGVTAGSLTGCAGSDPGLRPGPSAGIEPGPSAGTSACSALIARLPPSLLDLERGRAPAAGSAAWGGVVLRCGVPEPPPTTESCINTNGIDWIFSEDDSDYRFVTYGRSPAVEVSVPKTIARTRAPGAMTGLTAAVRPVPQTRTCD